MKSTILLIFVMGNVAAADELVITTWNQETIGEVSGRGWAQG
jgi:hypothetical protein